MAAYVIAQIEVTDPEGFERYRQMVPATIEQYGGRYVVRGGRFEALEGDWDPKRLVVLEFESYERAKQWWASEAYRDAKQLRQSTTISKLVLVEGL